VLGAIGARVVEGDVVLGHAHTKFDEDGALLDETTVAQLDEVLDCLLQECAMLVAA
jgi:hypothetical protein